jgi:hypothetical protein
MGRTYRAYLPEQDFLVGTFTEISTLFFWAFGLDLTLDTIKTGASGYLVGEGSRSNPPQ